MNDRPFAGKAFLVVEDDPFSRRIVERLLRDCGALDIHLAADGIEAVARAQGLDRDVDCIVSDLNMKPMHGLYLLQAVRAGVVGLRRETPAVIVTGNASDQLLRYAIELDSNGFVAKPVSRDRIEKSIARALAEDFDLREPRHYAAIKLPSKIRADEFIKISGIDFPVYNSSAARAEREDPALPEVLRMFPSGHPISLS